jgi:hypothetical protein
VARAGKERASSAREKAKQRPSALLPRPLRCSRPAAARSMLPLALLLVIFALLPADARLRSAAVCRAWRAALADPALWARLALPAGRASDALLRTAVGRARGALRSLDLSACDTISHATLIAVVTASGATLRELRLRRPDECAEPGQFRDYERVAALCCAAPQLQLFSIRDVTCVAEHAIPLLRNEPPFAAVRLRRLHAVWFHAASVLALAAALPAHASLASLFVDHAPLDAPGCLDALVHAVVACRALRALTFSGCDLALAPAAAPALARLLAAGALASLCLCNEPPLLRRGGAAAALAAALAASSTLTQLSLNDVGLFADPAATAALLRALRAHPRLRSLQLQQNALAESDDAARAAAGAALAELLSHATALQHLDLSACRLGDAGLAPLAAALRSNTHSATTQLQSLFCGGNAVSDAFAREQLLPAVRASAAVRELRVGAHLRRQWDAVETAAAAAGDAADDDAEWIGTTEEEEEDDSATWGEQQLILRRACVS